MLQLRAHGVGGGAITEDELELFLIWAHEHRISVKHWLRLRGDGGRGESEKYGQD